MDLNLIQIKSKINHPLCMRLKITAALTMAIMAGFSACSSISVQTPRDFVHYHKTASPYKAISAEGVRLMVSRRPNDPQGELNSWHNVLLQEMKQKGYRVLDQGDTQSRRPSLPGKYTIFLHKYRGRDHAYLLALFVAEKKIILAEAAGHYPAFQKHKDKLLQALKTIEIK